MAKSYWCKAVVTGCTVELRGSLRSNRREIIIKKGRRRLHSNIVQLAQVITTPLYQEALRLGGFKAI